MKKLKKLIVLFTAALFCMLPILSQPLTAQASNPVTYYVKYDTSKNEWRYQVGSSWDTKSTDRAFYYLTLEIKDGDVVVVDGTGTLSFNVHLSNLTVLSSDLAVVSAKSFDDVYVLKGQGASVSGDIKNAYVYDGCIANLNNNVQNLYAYESCSINVLGNVSKLYVYDPTDPDAEVNCLGTVDYVKAYDDDYVYYEYYNFPTGSLKISRGNMDTDASLYSTSAPAASTVSSAATGSTSSASSDELDDVPKTGDFSISPLWLLGIAAVCMLGYFKLERR